MQRYRISGGVLLAVALAVAGCGGAGRTSSATPTPEPSSLPPTIAGSGSTPGAASTAAVPQPPAASATSTATTGAAPAGGACATAQLDVVMTEGQGAAGTEYSGITFRNRSSSTCTLQGYPGVSLLDKNRAQIGQPAVRVPEPSPLVVLKAGQAATASFSVGPAACGNGDLPPKSAYLRVFPPNQRADVTVAAQVFPCAPRIRPVHPGAVISN
ncbi:MAG TPA: DUF4232 domain-containing protein [Frankiaceae bacterium]|nr:DUF4232 domain-containing protein [Frankiaceae bacterium]